MSRQEVPKARYRTKAQIASEAAKHLKWYCPERLVTPGPVPVAEFLEHLQEHIPVSVEVVDSLPSPTEAITVPDEGEFEARLLIDSRVYDRLWDGNGRARFTAAHEAYHLIAHRNEIRTALPNGEHQGLHRRADLPWNVNPEWQAENYAANFLLPEPAVRAAVQQIGINVSSLADLFQVSFRAMEVRLRVLGLDRG